MSHPLPSVSMKAAPPRPWLQLTTIQRRVADGTFPSIRVGS